MPKLIRVTCPILSGKNQSDEGAGSETNTYKRGTRPADGEHDEPPYGPRRGQRDGAPEAYLLDKQGVPINGPGEAIDKVANELLGVTRNIVVIRR